MTRTFRLNKTDREGRLARLFLAYQDARRIYAQEARELRELERARLADDMAHATTRVYASPEPSPADALDYDWRIR